MTTDNHHLALELINTRLQRDHARTLACRLEAENHALTQAAHNLIGSYIGRTCPDLHTCDCALALAHLTRLLNP